jgi:DNA ligase-1
MSAIQIIERIKNAKGSKNKLGLIVANHDNTDFMYGLKVLLDDTFVLGVKEIPEEWYTNTVGKLDASNIKFRQLVEYLRNNNRSTKTMNAIKKFLSTCNAKEAPIYAGILTKSYKIGVTGKAINKVLDTPLVVNFTLQKAEPFDECKLDFTKGYILGEEKYDGVRCAIFYDAGDITAFTFNGRVVKLDTIGKAIERLCNEMGVDRIMFDGELLSSKERVATSGLVNKLIKKPEVNTDADLYFMIFHFMPLDEFKKRKCSDTNEEVANKLGALDANSSYKKIKFSKSYVLRNMEEIEHLFKEVREKGGEGVMLKSPDANYEWKRSRTWLKLKSMYSTTLEVVDIYLAGSDTKYKGLIGGLVCTTKDGLEVRVGSGLSDDDRLEFLDKSRIVGKMVEVAFTDANFNLNGDIFIDFPRYKGIREDKEEADTIDKMLAEVPKWKKSQKKLNKVKEFKNAYIR